MSLILKQNNTIYGHSMTPQRQRLLELLHQTERHIDAREMCRRTNTKDESICPATAYRSLNLFRELGNCRQEEAEKGTTIEKPEEAYSPNIEFTIISADRSVAASEIAKKIIAGMVTMTTVTVEQQT